MGAGAFSVGNIEATVTAVLDTSKYDRAIKKLRGDARHPIEQHVGAKVDRRSFADADKHMSRLEHTSGKISAGFAGVARGAGLAAGVIGVGLGGALVKAGKSLAYNEQLHAQTVQALKTTKSAAGVTAAEIEKLSDSIEKKSGMEAEAIQSGQNLLLTFTNVRNEAGKGNDIFDQTTKVMADMSVALGQDTKSSAMQLGKALNDPIKGVTALQRVGVTFTKGQKDQIAAMVKHGDTAKAQRVILKELNKEFGGSAKAQGKTLGGQWKIAQAYLGDFVESIVKKAMPTISKLVKAFGGFTKGMTTGKGAGGQFAKAVGSIMGAVGKVMPHLIAFGKGAIKAGKQLIEALKPAMPFIRNVVIPLIKGLAKGVGGSLAAAFKVAIPIIKVIAEVLGWIGKKAKPVSPLIEKLGMVLGFLFSGPILKGIGAMGKMGGVLGALGKVAGGVGRAFSAFGKLVGGVLGKLLKPIEKLVGLLGKVAQFSPAGLLKSGLGKLVGKFFAKGGPVNGAQVAVVGEDGEEVVVPVNAKHRAAGLRWLTYAAAKLGAHAMADGGAAGASALRSRARTYETREDALSKQLQRQRTLWESSGGGLSAAERAKLAGGEKRLGGLYASERKVIAAERAAIKSELADLRAQRGRAHKAKDRERLGAMIERRTQMGSDAAARYRELSDLIADGRVDATVTRNDNAAAKLQAAIDGADKTPLDAAIETFRTNQSLAKLTADDADDKAASGGLLGALKQRLSVLQARLPKLSGDAFAAAQSAIGSTAEEIAGFADGAGAAASGPSLFEQVANLNSERLSLLTQMGGNSTAVSPAGGLGRMRPAAGAPVSKTINMPVTFRESPKDNHAWIKDASRNAQAFL